MEQLSPDIEEIINEYRWGAEHYDKYKKVLIEIHRVYWCMKRSLVNREFGTIFYPGFWSELFFDPWPALTLSHHPGGVNQVTVYTHNSLPGSPTGI